MNCSSTSDAHCTYENYCSFMYVYIDRYSAEKLVPATTVAIGNIIKATKAKFSHQ